MKCSVCTKGELSPHYKGKIRHGKFPNVVDALIYRCSHCQVQKLEGEDINYETSEYRELVDRDATPEAYYEQHDQEQAVRLGFFELASLRNATCVDVGAGAGSFLDLIKGFASRTIAIEPATNYHKELQRKGHDVFSYSKDALRENTECADFVTCFSVIEHIPEPREFLSELVALAKKGGTIILSTPNTEDWLIELLPDYKSFFYRVVHKWYFNAFALKSLAKDLGLTDVEIQFHHRFKLTNALNWIKDKRPTGNSTALFSDRFETSFQQELQASGKSDYIYFIAKKK